LGFITSHVKQLLQAECPLNALWVCVSTRDEGYAGVLGACPWPN